MKNFIACLAFVFLLLSCGGQQSTTSAVKVQHLTCEHRENPIGVGLEQQRFSWQIQTDLQDVKQEAYRILVASSKENSKKAKPISGIPESRLLQPQF